MRSVRLEPTVLDFCQTMRVDIDPPADGPCNMGKDLILLALAESGEPGARIYTWDGPWLSLGCFQRPSDVTVELGNLPWVLRPTGGKAVRHGADLTVSIALPLKRLGLESRQVKGAYRAVANPLIEGLRAAGIRATLAEGTKWCNPAGKQSRTTDCFAHNSPNDIVDEVSGAKVCGCALRVTETAVLLQASIPLVGTDPLVLARAIRPYLLELGAAAQTRMDCADPAAL